MSTLAGLKSEQQRNLKPGRTTQQERCNQKDVDMFLVLTYVRLFFHLFVWGLGSEFR